VVVSFGHLVTFSYFQPTNQNYGSLELVWLVTLSVEPNAAEALCLPNST
jgi:hypothetical protein